MPNGKTPHVIHVNNSTRDFLLSQGQAAEFVFQVAKKSPPLRMTDKQWRALLARLSASCRRTASLLAQYRAEVENLEGITKPVNSGHERSRQQFEAFTFADDLSALQVLWAEAQRNFGGLDNGLTLLARYLDAMRKRPIGRKKDWALTSLITGKLIAYVAEHGSRSIVYWSDANGEYRGIFLGKMAAALRRLRLSYGTRTALAKRILAIQKMIRFSFSESTPAQTQRSQQTKSSKKQQ
jgi:hypothetical protein